MSPFYIGLEREVIRIVRLSHGLHLSVRLFGSTVGLTIVGLSKDWDLSYDCL